MPTNRGHSAGSLTKRAMGKTCQSMGVAISNRAPSPAMWKKGNHETMAGTVPVGGVPALAALARDHATARPWVMRTPLGAAVLPDVHSTIARSEGETRAGRWSGAGGAWEDQSSFGRSLSRRSRYWPSPTISEQPVASANDATWEEKAAGSRTRSGAGRGTRAPPASQVPHAHSAHSGQLGPMRPTMSPMPTPARPSSAALLRPRA